MAETENTTATKTKSCYAVTRQAVSEQVAIAEAIADRLGKRQGQRTDLSTSGNISGSEDSGRTTDIAASKAGAKPPS